MTFYDRYISGETKTVYDDIYKLGQDAFLAENFTDIEKVMAETFHRVAYNLDIIYKELKAINYFFKTEFKYNFERPLIKPLPNTGHLLKTLDETVSEFGFIPLSLKMFYEIVGACNFAWDYEKNEELMWNYADPIQICSIDDLVSTIDEDWLEETREMFNNSEYINDPEAQEEYPHLEISADFYHKDNVSGGMPYCIKITKTPSIDSRFLFEPHNTTFINYLRICFENCGFSRITIPENKNNYQAFFQKVKPLLKKFNPIGVWN